MKISNLICLLLALCAMPKVVAQPKTNGGGVIYDVISLKNDAGTVKGHILEQRFGQYNVITINPVEATLTFAVANIHGGSPQRVQTADGQVQDVLKLKGQQISSISGTIVSELMGKSYTINSNTLPKLTFMYDEIESLCKEVEREQDNQRSLSAIYGIVEQVNLRDGSSVSGVITKQNLGRNLTLFDEANNSERQIEFSQIKSITKLANDLKKSIFEQSYYLDIILTQNNASLKGIIIHQVPGENVILLENGEDLKEHNIPYSQIIRIAKVLNPDRHKEEINAESVLKTAKLIIEESSTTPEQANLAEKSEMPTLSKQATVQEEVEEEPINEIDEQDQDIKPLEQAPEITISDVWLYKQNDELNKLKEYRFKKSRKGVYLSPKSKAQLGAPKFSKAETISFYIQFERSKAEKQLSSINISKLDKDKKGYHFVAINKVASWANYKCELVKGNTYRVIIPANSSSKGDYSISYKDSKTLALFSIE